MDRESLREQRWHRVSAEESLKRLDSKSSGLTAHECQRRLDLLGPKKLRGKKRKNGALRFLVHFHN